MSGGQVLGVVVVAVIVLWALVQWLRTRRKRWGRPLSQRNVRTVSKGDRSQAWRSGRR